ncbi:23S rRNA (pseudouridine(1915)-N(3))-methyltransferase RlmH [Nitrospirillum sp. BR 11828]|uniref:23S rRNA (pseudouridine(1915)-N(3))-methyltransferase RlmH n=1 Tax=Nitrospirillum sp. BR 11828 TaxID=3104325 RepID=UPI002ACA1249|nr:23S rRNA (pseudouridine(1915)-N(3))-methyltransferase RlmH [Nitrospirillum sp. BR 11828]MDZ5646275.1 23S rRNA (pseudouridine(1915)-N(3))-methyltransferase RlmH [Nitrospirillum sp. BR 11828]
MRVWLIAVGRSRPGPARDLFEEYKGRITWPFTLREVECRKRVEGDELKRLEAQLLLEAIPPGATLVAMDERGKALPSEAFARQVGTWRDGGVADLAFVIGGADGLAEEVRRRASLLIAFGPMTWPHMMVRGMLAEQLYRAQQILAGHPYHRV